MRGVSCSRGPSGRRVPPRECADRGFSVNERGRSHQKSHRHRPGWSGPEDCLRAARGGPTAEPGAVEGTGGLRPRRHDPPRANSGGLVDVRDRDQPWRPWDLRLPPAQSQDLLARPGPQPIRAEERLPAAEGREPEARNADLGAAQGRGPRRDRAAVPLHVSARPDPGPDALRHGRPRPPRRAGDHHVLHHRRHGQAPRERERPASLAGRRCRRRVLHPSDRPAQSKTGADLRVDLAIRVDRDGGVASSSGPMARPKNWRSAREPGATGYGSSSSWGCSNRSAGWCGST